MRLPSSLTRLTAGTLLLAASALAAPAVVLADDHDDDDDFGAYVYAATCDALAADAVIEDIGELELEDDQDDIDEYWAVLGNDQDLPSALYAEDEDIEGVTMDDLVAEPHAIAVHADDSRDSEVIACGEVNGDAAGDLYLFDLQEVDDSGFDGRAAIQPDDDDDDDDDDNDLDVVVGVWPAGEVEPLGTPAA